MTATSSSRGMRERERAHDEAISGLFARDCFVTLLRSAPRNDENIGGAPTLRMDAVVQTEHVRMHAKVRAIEQSFPAATMLTGIVHEGRVVLVEGMHRACAIVRMTQSGRTPVALIAIALAPYIGALPLLGKGEGG